MGLRLGRIAIEEVLKRGRDHTGAALPQLIGNVLLDKRPKVCSHRIVFVP